MRTWVQAVASRSRAPLLRKDSGTWVCSKSVLKMLLVLPEPRWFWPGKLALWETLSLPARMCVWEAELWRTAVRAPSVAREGAG